MALLSILKYPDPRLNTVAEPVTEVNLEVRELVEDMAETMFAATRVGRAATQVDVHRRVIVIDISETKDELLVLINPEILESTGEVEREEGCLSVPGVYEGVVRAEQVRVGVIDIDGKPFQFDASGLLAVCIQHEMDHLKGIVFVEYLSRLKQERIARKMRKAERMAL